MDNNSNTNDVVDTNQQKGKRNDPFIIIGAVSVLFNSLCVYSWKVGMAEKHAMDGYGGLVMSCAILIVISYSVAYVLETIKRRAEIGMGASAIILILLSIGIAIDILSIFTV